MDVLSEKNANNSPVKTQLRSMTGRAKPIYYSSDSSDEHTTTVVKKPVHNSSNEHTTPVRETPKTKVKKTILNNPGEYTMAGREAPKKTPEVRGKQSVQNNPDEPTKRSRQIPKKTSEGRVDKHTSESEFHDSQEPSTSKVGCEKKQTKLTEVIRHRAHLQEEDDFWDSFDTFSRGSRSPVKRNSPKSGKTSTEGKDKIPLNSPSPRKYKTTPINYKNRSIDFDLSTAELLGPSKKDLRVEKKNMTVLDSSDEDSGCRSKYSRNNRGSKNGRAEATLESVSDVLGSVYPSVLF